MWLLCSSLLDRTFVAWGHNCFSTEFIQTSRLVLHFIRGQQQTKVLDLKILSPPLLQLQLLATSVSAANVRILLVMLLHYYTSIQQSTTIMVDNSSLYISTISKWGTCFISLYCFSNSLINSEERKPLEPPFGTDNMSAWERDDNSNNSKEKVNREMPKLFRK